VVQIRNTTAATWSLRIKPAPGQPLRAPTTFAGILRPKEVKVVYLYSGFDYQFETEPRYTAGKSSLQVIEVDSDIGLVFAGDSLGRDEDPLVLVGKPVAVRADDRQSIRARYGDPDRRVVRTVEPEPEDLEPTLRGSQTAFALPYEVWIYFETGYKYVFLDEFRSGNFALVNSTDPTEPERAGWTDRLSKAAVDQILRE
jgi:hypothetical protein